MSTLPTITVGANDLTDWLQDRSMSVKRNGCDATFIDEVGDMPAIPLLGDTLVVTDPDWTGTVVSVVSTGWKGNVPFYKVRATNDDVLPDAGPAPFGISDTPNHSTTFGFKDLEVTRILDNGVEEVRSKCIVFQEGLSVGMEIPITSVVEGYSAETFTIMELTYDWPISDGATYTLDLGKGVFADATTGGGDGGPLDPVTLPDEIVKTVEDAGCCDEDGMTPSPGNVIPVTTITGGGVCDTSPVNKKLEHKHNGEGLYTDTLGASGSGDEVGSWVANNVAYTSSDYPCPAGGGSWHGYHDQECWVEYNSVPADDPTEYLGLTTTIDTSIFENGLPEGYYVKWAQGAAASTRFGEGTIIAAGVVGGSLVVTIPRNLVAWGGTNCLVLAPAWSCDRPVQFCNPAVNFDHPHDDGRGHSGSYEGFGFDDLCPIGLEAGGDGFARDVAGIGDTDGVNNDFELLHWTGIGEVTGKINGLPIAAGDISYDIGTSTVSTLTPPPADSIVLWTYRANT